MDKKSIGKRIRQKRENLSLTRDEFAEKVAISPQFLAEIENGKKGISAETLYKICMNVNVSADYILLGRQTGNNTTTPAIELLLKIPPQFSEYVENILKSLIDTIELAEKQK